MKRLQCPCGRIVWDDHRGACPKCGRPRSAMTLTNEEYGSDRQVRSTRLVIQTGNKDRLIDIMAVVHEALIAAGASPSLGKPYYGALCEQSEDAIQKACDRAVDLNGVKMVLFSPET